jgi:hypothetical protein
MLFNFQYNGAMRDWVYKSTIDRKLIKTLLFFYSLLFTKKRCPVVSALLRAIAVVKQLCSVIGWVSKNLLSRAPPCFGTHVKPLIPAAFAVVSIQQSTLGPRGGLYSPFSLCVIHKEGLCPSSGGINRLMMMMRRTVVKIIAESKHNKKYYIVPTPFSRIKVEKMRA